MQTYLNLLDHILTNGEKKEDRRFSEIISIVVDEQVFDSLQWVPQINHLGDWGVMAMVPIKDFENGRHTLYFKLKEKYAEMVDWMPQRAEIVPIPFWIDRSNYQYNIQVNVDSTSEK